MATVTVSRFQVRRSYTAGYRPPTTGATALKAGEQFINYADRVILSGRGDGTWITSSLDAIVGDAQGRVPSSKTAFAIRNQAQHLGLSNLRWSYDTAATVVLEEDDMAPVGFKRTLLRVTAGALGSGTYLVTDIDWRNPETGSYGRHPIAPNTTYDWQVTFNGDPTDSWLGIDYYDAAGSVISGGPNGFPNRVPSSLVSGGDVENSNRFSIIAKTPANAVTARVTAISLLGTSYGVGKTWGFSAFQKAVVPDGTAERSRYVEPRATPYTFGVLGLAANGTTDVRSALAAIDAARSTSTIELPAGTYRIASNITLSAHYRIPRGVIFKPDNGVTITFNGGIAAGAYQIFDLSAGGSISGLPACEVDWFHSFKNTGTDCIPMSQKAYDAVVDSGTVNWGIGYYTAAGGTIIASRGQKSIGRGRWATQIRWSTGATNFIKFTGGVPHHHLSGFRFSSADQNVRATSGKAIWINVGNGRVTDIDLANAYDGIYADGATFGSRIDHVNIGECRNTGIYCNTASDLYISDFIISSLGDTLTLSNVVGAFQPGETLTVSGSPFKATVYYGLSGNRLRVNIGTEPVAGTTTIKGDTSGATATIASIDYDFQNGTVRLENQCESITFNGGDVIGGYIVFATAGTAFARGQCPAFSKFTNVYFDTAHNGLRIDKAGQLNFTNCWMWAHGNHAIVISNTNGMKFIGCEIGGGQNWGLVVNSNNKNWMVSNCNISGNTIGGIVVNASGNQYFWIINNSFTTDFHLPGAVEGYGILLQANCGDYFWISQNAVRGVPNSQGLVDNSGTAAGAKYVDRNFG